MERDKELPPWEQRLKAELLAANPRLWRVYWAYYYQLHAVASMQQLADFLVERGHSWARVNRSTMWRWMQEIDKLMAKHRGGGVKAFAPFCCILATAQTLTC